MAETDGCDLTFGKLSVGPDSGRSVFYPLDGTKVSLYVRHDHHGQFKLGLIVQVLSGDREAEPTTSTQTRSNRNGFATETFDKG